MRTICFGICGCGDFMERAVLPMMQKVRDAKAIAACGGHDKTQVDKVCRQFKISCVCPTFKDLLKVDDVDAVYIASPNVFHKEQTIAAARAGKHVFCQKPMGMNAAECSEMMEVCRKEGVKLGIGFCYRFQGAQQQAKQLIKQGAIGEVSYIYISYNLPGYNPETVGWRCDPKMSGGGPLMDVAPHLIDLACFFLDDQVESVMAYVRPDRTETEIEIDALALLQFSRGARASIDTSFVRGNRHNYTIVGTKGEIHAAGTMAWRTGGRLTLRVEGEEKDIPFSDVEHIEQELRLYCSAVARNEQPSVPGEAGLHVQAVIDTVYESGQTGKRHLVKY